MINGPIPGQPGSQTTDNNPNYQTQ